MPVPTFSHDSLMQMRDRLNINVKVMAGNAVEGGDANGTPAVSLAAALAPGFSSAAAGQPGALTVPTLI